MQRKLREEISRLQEMVGQASVEKSRLWFAAREVMDLLDEHGADIVPHLIDSDDNPGQRLRDLLESVGKTEG